MSNTPETDAAIKASNGQWSFVLKETCQRLERERDETREDAHHNAARANANAAECCRAWRERNEAREKAERYRLEANAMMLQRDEAWKALRQILAETNGRNPSNNHPLYGGDSLL